MNILFYAQVFDLTREQERTKQAEASKEQAQYHVYAEQQKRVRICTELPSASLLVDQPFSRLFIGSYGSQREQNRSSAMV